jgi:aldose sugar dehydrogenase
LGFIIIPSPTTLRYFDHPYHIDHPYHNNDLAYALDSKYPEAGLPSPKGPIINDPALEAEVVFKGLRYPTSMAFLGPNDILVT